MNRGVYVDVETTGLRAYNAHIVEAAAVVMDENGRLLESFVTLANPGKEALQRMDPSALATHGLTPEMLESEPDSQQAGVAFRGYVEKQSGCLVYAFNSNFDRSFLSRIPWSIPPERWGECIMEAAQKLMKDVLPRFPDGTLRMPSLARAAKFFGVKQDLDAHRALPDAKVAARIHAEIQIRRQELEPADEGRDFLSGEA